MDPAQPPEKLLIGFESHCRRPEASKFFRVMGYGASAPPERPFSVGSNPIGGRKFRASFAGFYRHLDCDDAGEEGRTAILGQRCCNLIRP